MWTIHRRLAHRGFALASAIFILVVLAALAVGITLLTTQSETGVAQDLRGSRAYHAARSGLDWGAYRVLDPLNTTATSGSAALPNCPGAAGSICPTAASPLSAAMPDHPVCLDRAGRLCRHAAMLVHRPHGSRPQHPRVSAQIDRHVRNRSHRSGAAGLGSRRLLPRSQRQPREPASLRVQLMRLRRAVIWISLLGLSVGCSPALARTCTSAGNGNWNASATWNAAMLRRPGGRRHGHRFEQQHRHGHHECHCGFAHRRRWCQQLHVDCQRRFHADDQWQRHDQRPDCEQYYQADRCSSERSAHHQRQPDPEWGKLGNPQSHAAPGQQCGKQRHGHGRHRRERDGPGNHVSRTGDAQCRG